MIEISIAVKISKIIFIVAVLIFSTSIACASVNNATVNETAIESLIQDLADQNLSVKVNAVTALVEMGEPAVEPLIQALKDNNPEVRENAAHALGKIKDEKAVDPLIELLADEQWEVQKAARDALVNIGEPALELLVKVMNDPNENYLSRENAIRALGEIGGPAVEPLIRMLDSKGTGLDATAAYSLRVIGEPAVGPLIQALEDDDPQVRARAAEALSGMKDDRAIEPLTKALNDKNERVRIFAKLGLERMENQQQTGVIANYGKEREFYIEDERREWIEKLGEIIHGARDDMSLYFYPEGPVIAYGCDSPGYIGVSFLEGSDINESLMDEIYGLFDQQAIQMGIHDVPVLFQLSGMVREDEGPAPDAHNIPGFTAITLLMAFLGLRRMR